MELGLALGLGLGLGLGVGVGVGEAILSAMASPAGGSGRWPPSHLRSAAASEAAAMRQACKACAHTPLRVMRICSSCVGSWARSAVAFHGTGAPGRYRRDVGEM